MFIVQRDRPSSSSLEYFTIFKIIRPDITSYFKHLLKSRVDDKILEVKHEIRIASKRVKIQLTTQSWGEVVAETQAAYIYAYMCRS